MIMNRVDAWADENAGWDCRAEAEAEVNFILNSAEYDNWDDDRIVEAAIRVWEEAE